MLAYCKKRDAKNWHQEIVQATQQYNGEGGGGRGEGDYARLITTIEVVVVFSTAAC